ncbi:MAG: TrbI/VirB10 family protein [Novosphingobium sp.]|nr:TrbI/VirB10 family protein [Novosphingobium sp.]
MRRNVHVRPYSPADAARSPRRRQGPATGDAASQMVPVEDLTADFAARPGFAPSQVTLLIAGVAVLAVLVGLGFWMLGPPQAKRANGVAETRIELPRSGDYSTTELDALPALPGEVPEADGTEEALADAAADLPAPALQSVLPALDEPVLAASSDPAPSTASSQVKRGPAPLLVFDAGSGSGGSENNPVQVLTGTPRAGPADPSPSTGNKAMVSRGTLIPAVLESVIDAGKPGGVRAVVTTDVRSSDGSKVLIPKSSRLVGQYRSDGTSANGKTYVTWTRIVPPGGKAVSLPAGGSGFEGAKLQSVVSGSASDTGTVRVRQGEPVRVYAASDIDLGKGR